MIHQLSHAQNRMTPYMLRLDGRMKNLKVNEGIAIPRDFAPHRNWFYKRAKIWQAKEPGFAIKTSLVPGEDYLYVSRIA